MPVLREDDLAEALAKPVDDRDDCLAIRDRKAASSEKVSLHVNHQQNVALRFAHLPEPSHRLRIGCGIGLQRSRSRRVSANAPADTLTLMSRPFHAEARLRVRYAETDQMGVVYHANYLVWFEVGRVEMLRSLGIPYQRLEQEFDCLIAVVGAELPVSRTGPVRR